MTDFTQFIRKPFVIKACLVTKENITELAPMIGKVKFDKDKNEPYIRVNPDLVPNVYKVFLGYYVTRMPNGDKGENIRCYAPDIFHQQFTPMNEELDEWVKSLNDPTYIREDLRTDA